MWFSRKPPPLAQERPAPDVAALEERIEKLERGFKHLSADADTWISKYRTLYARTCAAAERIERHGPQEAAGPTIAPPGGVTPPPPPPDRWVGLQRAQKAASERTRRPA